MDCPNLESLGLALDLDPEHPDHVAAARHVAVCVRCEDNAKLLASIEVTLGRPAAWGEEEVSAAVKCLDPDEMILAVSGKAGAREGHLVACDVCRSDYKALRNLELAPVSASLRSRLRRLSPQGSDETVREKRPRSPVRLISSRRTTGRRRVGSARTTGAARRSSLRVPQRSVTQPVWAYAALGAAAAFLVFLAIALSPPAPRSHDVATDASTPPRTGVRVSDVQGQQPRERPAPPTVEPSYPLPSTLDDEPGRPLEPVDLSLDPPEDGEQPAEEPAAAEGPAPDGPLTTPRPEPQEPARETPEQEPAVVDDGGRLELAMARLGGAVVLERNGVRQKLTRRGQPLELQPGDRLHAKAGGFLSLEGGAYELCLGKDTEVVVRGAVAGPVLGLRRGRLLAEVATLRAGKRFQILTAQGTFSVLGTVFAVESSAGNSRVLVAEGTVKAAADGASVRVASGMSASLTVVNGEATPSQPERFRAEELTWAKALAPKRQVLYGVGFNDNKLGGFGGDLATDHQPRGGKALVLAPLERNRYWGQAAMVGQHRMPSFRAADDVFVQFSVWAEKPTQLMFQAFNDTQGKEFKRGFDHPGGYWRTFTVPLLELSTYYDPGKNPVREGDLFVDFEIYAARPGAAHLVLLDDVQIYRKLYR